MKLNLLPKCLLSGWLLFTTFTLTAHNGNSRDCGENCFETRIQEISETAEGCTRYTMLVTSSGGCAHALSHYTVGVPCGTVSEVYNSGGWKQELGIADPKTGLSGFKIDNISGFAEDGAPGEFTVEFTICPDGSCRETALECWAPEVAYKAGQCVFYEQTEVSCNSLAAHLETRDVTCHGAKDGSAEAIIESGEEPFTYLWSTNAAGAVVNNLTVGTYTVIITDAGGESVSLTATINGPEAIEPASDIDPASCSGSKDGGATVAVTGGTPPYSYLWSTGDTTNYLENVSAGYYEVTVTDHTSCAVTVPVLIRSAVTITLTGTTENTGCGTDSGSIDLTATGGTGPYSFSWSNGATSEDIDTLSSGIYNVQVTDANGCTAGRSFIIKENNPLHLTATTTKTACAENNSGSIDLTVSGGSEPYIYEWSDGSTTEDLNNLAQGIYTVQVRDQNGCEASLRVSVVAEIFQVNSETQNPSCQGDSDGLIQVTPSGGEAPYTYTWSNGSDTQKIEGLPGGLYDVTITDAKGCSRKLYFFLTDPLALSALASIENVNCVEGAFNLDLIVTGGTPPYSYRWSDGRTIEDIDSLRAGSYTVEITDSKGCTLTQTFNVDGNAAGCTEMEQPDNNPDQNPDDGSDDSGSDDGTNDETDDGTGGDTDDGTGDDTEDGNTGDDETDTEGGHNDDPGDNEDDFANCGEPFETEIELIAVEGNCYTYTATVHYDGNHSYGLSHFSVAVPSCGTIKEVTNSQNWKVEIGTDPTTDLSGFKIDDISNFGEGLWPEEFSVDFTVCATADACDEDLSTWDYTVGYKYGQCVDYDVVSPLATTASVLLKAYPNPFSAYTVIEFSNLPEGYTVVDIYNHRSRKVKQLFAGNTKKGIVYSLRLDATDLPEDTYTYRISTPSFVYSGKILLIRR